MLESLPVGILGCTGDIGSGFMNCALKSGLMVYAQVRMKSIEKADARINCCSTNARWMYGDIFDIDIIEGMLSCCNAIFSFAGMCGLGFPRESYVETLTVNGFFHGVLARLSIEMRREDVLYVYPSSQRVYLIVEREDIRRWIEKGVSEFEYSLDSILARHGIRDAVTEFAAMFIEKNGVPEGADIYEISKLLGEQFVLKLPNYSNIRISSVYGRGCWPRGKLQRIIYTLMKGKKRTENHDRRDFIYIDDLSQIILNIFIDAESKQSNRWRSLDAASGQQVDLADVLHKIQLYMPDLGGEVLFKSTDYGETRIDCRAAERLLRHRFVRIDVGIKKTVDYYLQEFRSREERAYLMTREKALGK